MMEPATLERSLDALRRYAGPAFLEALADPMTCELMLNGDGRLWQERFGEPMRVVGKMDSWKADSLIRQVASMLGKTITADTPQIDGELPLDGSRFSGVVPPVVSAPCFAIRKKASRVFTLSDYVQQGVLRDSQRVCLCDAIAQRRNILVVGGTGSGKTTLLNALIEEMVRQDAFFHCGGHRGNPVSRAKRRVFPYDGNGIHDVMPQAGTAFSARPYPGWRSPRSCCPGHA